jgi:hypothetical protein
MAGGDIAEAEVTQPAEAPPAATATSTGQADMAKPRFSGVGLAAGAGVLSGASLGVTIARSVLLKKNCPLDSMGSAACTYDFGSDIGLAATQWSLNFGVVGLGPAAGLVMGKHHAWKDEKEAREARNVRALRIAGGSLIGVGVAGVATSVALAFVLPARCLDKEASGTDPLAGDRCLLKSFPAWTVTNWASFQMIGAGGGMLGYGNRYKKHRPALSTIKVAPSAGPTYAGIGVAGKF